MGERQHQALQSAAQHFQVVALLPHHLAQRGKAHRPHRQLALRRSQAYLRFNPTTPQQTVGVCLHLRLWGLKHLPYSLLRQCSGFKSITRCKLVASSASWPYAASPLLPCLLFCEGCASVRCLHAYHTEGMHG